MSRKSRRAIIEERRSKVAALLLARVNYREIARQLGCSLGTVANDVKRIFEHWAAEQRPEDRERWKTIELAKLDQMEMGLTKAKAGEVAAVATVLRIMQRRARLLGLDAPKLHHVTFEDILGALDPELREQVGEYLASVISERGD